MLLFFNKEQMNRKRYFWYFVFNANMIIFFHKHLNKFNSKEYTKEPLWDKVNCKSAILLRMIDTCLKFLEKSSINL